MQDSSICSTESNRLKIWSSLERGQSGSPQRENTRYTRGHSVGFDDEEEHDEFVCQSRMEDSKINSFIEARSPDNISRQNGNQSVCSSNVKVFKDFLYSSNLEISKNETCGPTTSKAQKRPSLNKKL